MLEVIAEPDKLAVDLAEAKRHLGVTSNDRDVDIESLIKAATNYLQRRTGRTFFITQYRLNLSDLHVPSGDFCPIYLRLPPVQSVELVEYDYNGNTVEISNTQLAKNDEHAYLLPAANERWPAVESETWNALRVEYTAGFTTVPPEAKHAIKLLIRHWYDNASAVLTGSISKEIELGLASLVRSLSTGFYANVSTYEAGGY
jgi:uncharacterized phiE125 gp8 family phage protein